MPLQLDAAYHAGELVVRILPTRGDMVRVPYHIALLLDTSGSMEGEPLDAVIRTLHLLIDRMTDLDCLTIIQYAATASVFVNAATMTPHTKTNVHRFVDALTAEGGTNMEAAIETLGTHMAGLSKPINAIFLMTDGYVNTGITSSAGLLRLVSERLAPGIPVNTLGFGTSHNAAMLRDMAVKTRGSYTYADSTELIPAIIGDIIGGLADQVGSNAVLSATGGRCIELGATETHPEIYRVGSLIADKPQWVLFRGSAPPLQLTWTEGGTERRCEASMGILDRMDMEEQVQRVSLVETMTAVTAMLMRRDYNSAKSRLITHGQSLVLSIAAGRTFIIKLQAQVDEMLDDIRQQQLHPMNNRDAGILTRMVSNVTALGTQHGFFLSRTTSAHDPDIVTSPFSTPRQREETVNITQSFQEHE